MQATSSAWFLSWCCWLIAHGNPWGLLAQDGCLQCRLPTSFICHSRLYSIHNWDCGLAQVYSLDKTSEYKHHFDTARLAVPYFVKDARSFERQYPAAGRDRCAFQFASIAQGRDPRSKEAASLSLFTGDSPCGFSACMSPSLPLL